MRIVPGRRATRKLPERDGATSRSQRGDPEICERVLRHFWRDMGLHFAKRRPASTAAQSHTHARELDKVGSGFFATFDLTFDLI